MRNQPRETGCSWRDWQALRGLAAISMTLFAAASLMAAASPDAAAQTRGGRSVLDRLGVSPGQANDQEIYQRVLAALVADPAADAHELVVNVAGGLVTLEGKVQSYAERQLAVRVVEGIRGVRGIVNRIVVTADNRDQAGAEPPEGSTATPGSRRADRNQSRERPG